MGEALATLFNIFLLHLAVGKGSQILGAFVALAVDGEDLLIAVRHDDRGNDNGQNNADQNNQADNSKRVLEKLAHAILKEGGALAHHVLLTFLILRGRGKLGRGKFTEIDLGAEKMLLGRIL